MSFYPQNLQDAQRYPYIILSTLVFLVFLHFKEVKDHRGRAILEQKMCSGMGRSFFGVVDSLPVFKSATASRRRRADG